MWYCPAAAGGPASPAPVPAAAAAGGTTLEHRLVAEAAARKDAELEAARLQDELSALKQTRGAGNMRYQGNTTSRDL
jgi:hypothetical protein